MIQYRLLRWSPSLLRFYRTRLLLDWHRLLQYLPVQGSLLDVGCGVGSVDYELARARPALSILGIDITCANTDLARRYHLRPNIDYACKRLQEVQGAFDCILFIDVFHHVEPKDWPLLLRACRTLLNPDGYVLIKDVDRRQGQISWLMDRYVSGCDVVHMRSREEMTSVVASELKVQESRSRFRLPFGHYYIKAAPGAEPSARREGAVQTETGSTRR